MQKRVVPPILNVSGESMPEAWENSVKVLNSAGVVYKRDDPDDNGPQLAAMMTIEIRNPDADPFTHLMGGTNAVDVPLLDYYYEMMGAKNSWVKNFSDPMATEWDYLYNLCLTGYPDRETGKPINQIDWATSRIIKRPSSRRTNLITWHPPRDTKAKDTPCLQRIWFEVIPGEEKDLLDMHYSFRSRNVLNAAFGNMQGLYMLACHIRDRAEVATGRGLDLRMVDTTDTYHVNSHNYPIFKGVVQNINAKSAAGGLENRTWTRQQVMEGIMGLRDQVEADILEQTAKRYTGDMKLEASRVHAIGDRIFYLLDKYKPAVKSA